MKFLFIIFIILVSCKTSPPSLKTGDEIDKIIYLKKTNDPKKLIPTLGEPEKVDVSDRVYDQYYFFQKKDQMPITVFVRKKDQEITSIGLAYLVKFDAYAYLKKRFSNFQWIETELPLRTHLDYSEEMRKVEIPELGMSFKYDNQDPLRRPEWIFFK